MPRMRAALAVVASVLMISCAAPPVPAVRSTPAVRGDTQGTQASPGDEGTRTLDGEGYTFSYEPAEGWAEGAHGSNIFELNGPEGTTIVVARVMGIVLSLSDDGTYVADPAPAVDGVIDYLADHNDLDVSEPETVEIGGLPGQQVDVTVPGSVQVAQFLTQAEPIPAFLGLPPQGRGRAILLQHDTGVIVVGITTAEPGDFEAAIADAEPIIDSLEFE